MPRLNEALGVLVSTVKDEVVPTYPRCAPAAPLLWYRAGRCVPLPSRTLLLQRVCPPTRRCRLGTPLSAWVARSGRCADGVRRGRT